MAENPGKDFIIFDYVNSIAILLFFTTTINLIDKFKEIFQVKAVDIQTVIGNAGGCIGLFCGMN